MAEALDKDDRVLVLSVYGRFLFCLGIIFRGLVFGPHKKYSGRTDRANPFKRRGCMNFTNLRYFVRAYETGSFTETGKEFYVTQVAVSQQIKLVEAELETKLFMRKKNKIFPTREGDYFYKEAREILQRYDNASNMIKIHERSRMKMSG